MSGTTSSSSWLTVFAASVVAFSSLGVSAEAQTWSLSNDFSLSSNPNGAWSYRLENTSGDDDDAYPLLGTNSRSANSLWGTTFATSPTMWSEAAGFWGIGRNDTGVTQTSASVYWDPNEILFHPKDAFATNPPPPGRFVITWQAPSDTTIDVNWAYAKRMTVGANGVGMSVLHESGGVNTNLRSFADPNGAAGMFNNLTVAAGDQLHFRFDNWGDAGGDITWADVRVNQVASGTGAVIFSENFNSYAGNQNNTQFNTSLEVAFGGTVSGWSSAGGNAIHAVDLNNLGGQSNPSDWAIMLYADNVITQNSAIASSNDLGTEYFLSFDYGTATYAGPTEQTGPSDGLLVEILRGDDSVLASGEFFPGAWANNFNLNGDLEGTVSYVGDGTGDIRIRIGPVGPFNTGRFEGEIDNLVLQAFAAPVPEPASVALWCVIGIGLSTIAYCRKRRK